MYSTIPAECPNNLEHECYVNQGYTKVFDGSIITLEYYCNQCGYSKREVRISLPPGVLIRNTPLKG